MPSLRTSDTQATSTTTTVTLDTTGYVEDDLMLVVIYTMGNPTVTRPEGWTWIDNFDHSLSTEDIITYWRRASASEPSSYTWTLSASNECAGWLGIYEGVSTKMNPPGRNAAFSSANGTSIAASAVTTIGANAYIVGVYCSSTDWPSALSPPTGMTERWEDTRVYIADQEIASAGSTGTRTLTVSSSRTVGAGLIVLEDADSDASFDWPNVSNWSVEYGTSLGSSNSIPNPDGSETGDFVLHCVAVNSGALTGSTGWTAGTENNPSGFMRSRLFGRILDGSGDDAFALTGSSVEYSVISVRIRAGNFDISSVSTWLSNYTAVSNATSTSYNPPSIAPGAGTLDYLWMVYLAGDTNSSQQLGGQPFGPDTGYWEIREAKSSANTASVAGRLSMKQTTSSSEDPPSNGISSMSTHAWTIGVPPAAAPADADINATVVTGAASVPAPTIAAGTGVSPTVVTAAASVPAPSVAAGNASVSPSVVTGAGSAPSPLVFSSVPATGSPRSYVYIDEFIASLALVTPRGSDRVIIQSSIDGELATLGMDDVEGDLDPPVPTPPNLPPLPPGTPDPPTPPGGGSPIPVPPNIDPPPGSVDPGHPGELEQVEGPYVFWDSRVFRTGDTLNMGGLSEEALSTDSWGRLAPGSYNAAVGNMSAAGAGGWEIFDFALASRIWSTGQLGGTPYGTSITWVVGFRPDPAEASATGGADLRLGGPSSGAGFFEWDMGLGWVDGERRMGLRVFHQSSDVDTDGAGSPLPGPIAGQWMDITWGTNPDTGSITAELLTIPVPETQTSVLVITTVYPTGTPVVWLNQELVGPLYSRVRLLPSQEESTIFNWTRPFYLTPTPTGVENDFADYDSTFAQMSTTTERGAYGAFVQALFRGSPNENDLAVLQWRYGQ